MTFKEIEIPSDIIDEATQLREELLETQQQLAGANPS